MQRRHHQVGSINQRLIKLKQGQKTAFPFPPRWFLLALQKASTHLFLEPLFPTVFYPPTFCLPLETEPRSFICTLFYSYVYGFGLHSVLLFAVLWLMGVQFYKNVFYLARICAAFFICPPNKKAAAKCSSPIYHFPSLKTLV